MNWLESINIDWPISRRRFYGTEIQFGIAKIVQNHMFQNLENITDHGMKNVQ